MVDFKIRQLNVSDVLDFKKLRLEALQKSPDAFGSTYEQEAKQDDNFFEGRIEGSIIFGCFDGDNLVGLTCCLQDGSIKSSHIANIWGVYLKEEYRGQGIARNLFQAVLNNIPRKIEQIRLSVGAHNESAKGLYKSFGFEQYGYEERILKIDNRYYDEILMIKFLRK